MNNIYERLANGETAESIAQEFTDALNAAQTRMAEEAARKAEEEAKAALEKANRAATAAAKRTDMMVLIDAAFEYLAKYYPSVGLKSGDWDDNELKMIADIIVLSLDLEAAKGPRTAKPVVFSKKHTDDEVFADFFKQFNLLS